MLGSVVVRQAEEAQEGVYGEDNSIWSVIESTDEKKKGY